MKVAVTYGEDGLIFQHFGHTELFRIYTVESGEIISDETIDAGGSGHEALAAYLKSLGVSVLICGGIGGGAKAALDEAGIEIYAGISGLPDAAVEALARGILFKSSEANCTHHEESGEGGCDHGCGHGSGGCGGCCH